MTSRDGRGEVTYLVALSTMASARFVDPPDELRACSEAFHGEAMKHLDAVFEEQSYGQSSPPQILSVTTS